jgi:catechol 2,3-dioxygenase-like lactoylglutathione lyase family enzyme
MGYEITENRHVIAVSDLKRSAAYYRDVLGFDVHEIGDPGWRFFTREGCTVMAGECPDAVSVGSTGDHSYFAYWIVLGIDEYYERVVAAGAVVRKPLRDEPWGMKEFAIETVDGHRIMFGESRRSG